MAPQSNDPCFPWWAPGSTKHPMAAPAQMKLEQPSGLWTGATTIRRLLGKTLKVPEVPGSSGTLNIPIDSCNL